MRRAARYNVERQRPGWVIQHGAPPRHIRRAVEQIAHDRSGKDRVAMLRRLLHVDPITAAEIAEEIGHTAKRPRYPLANESVAYEAKRTRQPAPHCNRYSGFGKWPSRRSIRKMHAAAAKSRAAEGAICPSTEGPTGSRRFFA